MTCKKNLIIVSVSSWDYRHAEKEKSVNHRANVSQKHYDASYCFEMDCLV